MNKVSSNVFHELDPSIIDFLKSGGLVAIPTETVYGLAAVIDNPLAIKKIFETKKRPFFDPLIVHVSSIEMAKNCSQEWNLITQALAEKFWPGPLTMVLPKSDKIDPLITSGLEGVGLRMPNHPMTLELINKAGVPLAAPSANKFGRTSPSRAEHVCEEFFQEQDQIKILDGGACQIGIESTVLLIKGNQLSILRSGHITQEQITNYLKEKEIVFSFLEKVSSKESPGQMKHHYMPTKPLVLLEDRLNIYQHFPKRLLRSLHSEIIKMPDQWEGVKITKPKHLKNYIELQLSDDPTLAAREFYHQLRVCAEKDCDFIYFTKKNIHYSGEWEALMERLSKAAIVTLPSKPDLQIEFDVATTFRIFWKMVVFLIVISFYVLHSLCNRILSWSISGRRKLYTKTVSLYCRFFTKAMGLIIQPINLPRSDETFLMVGNHLGVLDILTVASVQKTLFITSQEMRNTPGLGLLSEMGGCLFVNRLNRSRIQKEILNIRETLQQGHNVVLFAEGTSTNGEKVLPLKKSLITAAAGVVPILPFVINYTFVNGQPMQSKFRDFVCWYGDQSFIEALLRILSMKSCVVTIEFLPEVKVNNDDDRHHLAVNLHKTIADKFVKITV